MEKAKQILYIIIALSIVWGTLSPISSPIIVHGSETASSLQDQDKEQDERAKRNQAFIDGLNSAGNSIAADVSETNEIIDMIKYVAAWIINIASYTIIAFLSVKVVIDLVYIALPFSRRLLENGYGTNAINQETLGAFRGNGQFGAGGQFGVPLRAPGGPRGPGGQFDINEYNGRVSSHNTRVQLVSTEALKAVTYEKQGENPFKIYIKSMVIEMILIPILILTTATGVLTTVGLLIGNITVNILLNINSLF